MPWRIAWALVQMLVFAFCGIVALTADEVAWLGLQEAMRRLDASRCNPVASESDTDRAPHRNGDTRAGTQPLVN